MKKVIFLILLILLMYPGFSQNTPTPLSGETHTLTIIIEGSGRVFADPPDETYWYSVVNTYEHGTEVYLTAISPTMIPCGYHCSQPYFAGWEGDPLINNSSIIIDRDKSVTAVFAVTTAPPTQEPTPTSTVGITDSPTPFPTAAPPPDTTIVPSGITGDVNGDESVDIIDSLLIAQYYVGLNPPSYNPQDADVNCDGEIDIVDALLISQYFVGLITGFPGCVPTPTPGTSGPTETYNPCPLPPELCKIMPSGDSITMGARSTDTGGYRVPLFRLVLENQNSVTFVGPSGAGPETVDGVPFPENHDGHSGYIIDTINTRKGLLPLMKENLAKFTPHIILLMIGTNDINSQIDLPNAPARLAGLIDLIIETAPDTLLVVAKLIPTRTDSLNNQVQDFNSALSGIVSERAEAGDHILMVDMYNAFTVNPEYKTDWLYDDLHPNDAGYTVMAKTWYDAIGEFLP